MNQIEYPKFPNVLWTAGGNYRVIDRAVAIAFIRPGDSELVTSHSFLADTIDWWTKRDTPRKNSPRVTHAEQTKAVVRTLGPVDVSAEFEDRKDKCCLVNKPASRHFVQGRSGIIFRHPAFSDPEVVEAMRDYWDGEQSQPTQYSIPGAILASNAANRLLGWIPAIKDANHLMRRATFCSRAGARGIIYLAGLFPQYPTLNPFKPGDPDPNTLSPVEYWFCLDRAMRETNRTGWDMIMTWNF